jgi:hypothetical protein
MYNSYVSIKNIFISSFEDELSLDLIFPSGSLTLSAHVIPSINCTINKSGRKGFKLT